MNRIASAVIDLDNCISDDNWRRHLINEEETDLMVKYRDYHAQCLWDSPFHLDVVRQLKASHELFIFTTRPEEVRNQTERWLLNKMIPYRGLFMRPNGNHEPSPVVKRDMLINLNSQYRVDIAMDDRVDILEMYANEGVRICRRLFINTTRS